MRISELVLGTGTVVTCMGKNLEVIFGYGPHYMLSIVERYLLATHAMPTFAFLGLTVGWLNGRMDGWTDEKVTPVYTNWHLMQRIGSWLAHPCY